MPMMDITYPEGALGEGERAKLIEDLTTALLRAERAPDTEFFRGITWVYVHELPREAVCAAGRSVDRPTFRLEVTTPEGALSDRRRAELVEAATSAIREASGIAEEDSLRIWVLLHEVAEESWGAAGQVIKFEELRAAARAQRDQLDPAGA